MIPQARETHEVILDKSFWTWGGEIGFNEHGVAVGNEAVFSNRRPSRTGPAASTCCAMLERGETAREAVEVVGRVVEAFGQGGNCEMRGNFYFDTGLLIADRSEAYVVNCAGRHWAARQVEDVMAISNRYQIGDDWDLSSLAARERRASRTSAPCSPTRSARVKSRRCSANAARWSF